MDTLDGRTMFPVMGSSLVKYKRGLSVFKSDIDILIEQGIYVNEVADEEEPRKEVMNGTDNDGSPSCHNQ